MRKQYNFWVYILTNWDKTTLYVGRTDNLVARLKEHYENRGKKETFAGRYYCYYLVYYEWDKYVLNSIAREKEIKSWSREKKEALIASFNPEWRFLNIEFCEEWPPKVADRFEKQDGTDPFGMKKGADGTDPFGMQKGDGPFDGTDPFGMKNPRGGTDPFGMKKGGSPFDGTNPFGMKNPRGGTDPFGMKKEKMNVAAKNIQMVDLGAQYLRIKNEIDQAILETVASTQYIQGPQVKQFQADLEEYLGVKHVIPCANGTDALQIAFMALELQPGDEVIVPSFTYVATAEVIALLHLKPVMVDVDPDTFNLTAELIEKAITPNTKAIVPVHLYGQSADMEAIMAVAEKHGLYVVEDTAQAIGSDYTFGNGQVKKAGTIGHIGCASFFPSKNLGCMGDGGAMMTNDDELAAKLRMIANHGQQQKYYHDVTGVNSRLDSLQAAILKVKLQYLDDYSAARQSAAAFYDEAFQDIKELQTPARQANSTHVFHQYTLQVKNGKRDALQAYLAEKGIPSMIYYPVPLYQQKAFSQYVPAGFTLPVTGQLCREVISLPIHTEMDRELLGYISETVKTFFL